MTEENKTTEQAKKVVIYSTPTCHFCIQAKEYFAEKGIEYTDYNVAEDQARGAEMVQKTGQMGVPVIMIGDEFVIGFNRPVINQLLGIEG